MTLRLLDPVADVEEVRQQQERGLSGLEGKKVGYVFNQHVTALAFWKKLEQEVAAIFSPSGVQRVYKVNTWAPAPQSDIDALIGDADYALIGVGA